MTIEQRKLDLAQRLLNNKSKRIQELMLQFINK